MRSSHDGSMAGRIARASTVLLATHRAPDDWSHDAVGAVRGLLRAHRAALLVSSDQQRHVYGDAQPSRLLEHLAAHPALDDVRRPPVHIGRSALADPAAAEAQNKSACADVAAATPRDERFDLAWHIASLSDAGSLLGVCCVFQPVSERTARARACLLQAIWPALEAAARSQMRRWSGRDEQHRLLHEMSVPAAHCTRDGTVLEVNAPLRRIMDDDGQADQLRNAIVVAVSRAMDATRSSADDVALVRTLRRQYRVRSRLLTNGAPTADGPSLLVLVEPSTGDAFPGADADAAERLRKRFRLTERECQVAHLLNLGHSNAAIAEALDISRNTARHHTERVMMKLGIQTRGAIHRLLADDAPIAAQCAAAAGRPALPADLAIRGGGSHRGGLRGVRGQWGEAGRPERAN